MESLTKNRQDKETLGRMAAKFFAPLMMTDCEELTEGYFNVAYKLCLSNGREVILKVAPPAGARIMTCEKNIMRSEVQAMEKVSAVEGIPAPKVLGFDESCQICEAPYFFMEVLSGRSLSTVKDTMTAKAQREVYEETGRIIRRVNAITCPCFGYPEQPAFQGMEWFPVFRKMLEAGIRDAAAGQVDLKIPTGELLRLLEKDRDVFAEVTKPCLVHWDCWDGNIFVESERVTGIIDWERCLWADPLMEVNFRTYGDNTWFRKGYGWEQFTDSEYRRALWYDIYLLILASLECEYRQYNTMDMYRWAAGLLAEQFGKLAL